MNTKNESKTKKPLPKMRFLKNTSALGLIGGDGQPISNHPQCHATEQCPPPTGPACGGATQMAGCTRMSVNNCPNG